MAEIAFDRKTLREIFEDAGIEVPPKDVLGKLCDLYQSASESKDDTIKELQKKLKRAEREGEAATADDGETWQSKYETAQADLAKAQGDLEKIKADQKAKEASDAKAKAAKSYLASKDFKDGNLEIALMALGGVVEKLDLDGENNIKDTTALDSMIDGKLAPLRSETSSTGADPATPPGSTGGKMTRAEIMAIKDPTERHKAIAENMSVFGY